MQDLKQDLEQGKQQKSTFLATMKAILWSFFGIRKRSDYEQDAEQLNPAHVIVAGIIGALIFIGTLLLIIKIVVAK